MLKTILAISGKPGLFKLVNRGKNMLIVESLINKRRTPAYSSDKVLSLGDITIYTTDDDMPLGKVFEAVSAKTDGKKVDIKNLGNDAAVRGYFKEIIPSFDEDRVYTTDIKKIFTWYNQLIDAGITEFVDKNETPEESQEEAPKEEK